MGEEKPRKLVHRKVLILVLDTDTDVAPIVAAAPDGKTHLLLAETDLQRAAHTLWQWAAGRVDPPKDST